MQKPILAATSSLSSETLERLQRDGTHGGVGSSNGKPNSSSEVNDQFLPRYFITAADDAAYLDAVRRDDMETAQRMVDEAAENAGYVFRGYHGTLTGEFTVFSTDRVVLTNNEKTASTYENMDAIVHGVKPSEKATKKSISPRLHTLSIANIDKIFNAAFIKGSHLDTHNRTEIKETHRLGSAVYDPETNIFHPVLLTVLEYVKDGVRLYSIEAIDVAKYKNSVGQLVAIAESERQTPITEFIGMISKAVENSQLKKNHVLPSLQPTL